MTKLQIEEFQALERAYLDGVRSLDKDIQIQMMEIIFYWLRKQMRAAQARLILMDQENIKIPAPIEVSEMQKQEFAFLQIAMIKRWGEGNEEETRWIELRMREWIDIQINDAVNNLIRPELKIIRNYKN